MFTAEVITTKPHIVSGTIDAAYIKSLRDDSLNISALDLSSSTIVAYEGTAGTLPFGKQAFYPANQFPAYAFYDYTKGKNTLTRIKLPNNINTIGVFAFKSCKNLVEVTMPDSVLFINESAFADCVNLLHIHFSTSLRLIDKYAFCNCREIDNLILPQSLITIENSAFQGCEKLRTVTLGKSILSIGESAFLFCTSLKSIECKAQKPPTIMQSTFDLTAIETVYVPAKSINEYKKHHLWGKYMIKAIQ